MTRTPPLARRSGFSLAEVLIALTIFLLALTVLSQIVINANDTAVAAELRARTTQLCQSKLAEVVAGVIPLTGQPETPFEEDEAFAWSVEAEQGSVAGLYNVTVRVVRQSQSGLVLEECSLSQMVLDPTQRGSTQDAVIVATSDAADPAATDSSQQSQTGQSSSPQSGSTSSGSTSGGSTSGSSGSSSPSSGGSSGGSTGGSSGGTSSPISPSTGGGSSGGSRGGPTGGTSGGTGGTGRPR